MNTVAGLLLAAGAGVRFGGPKQLARLRGKPLLAHALDALAPCCGEHLHVVLGAHRERIEPLVGERARVIVNSRWRDGLGSSIAAGVAALRARGDYAGLLIALADQVDLGRDDYRRLLRRFDGARIVAAHYAGAPGVPAIFPATQFDRLARLSGERGARAILRDAAAELVTVPLPRAARDIDTVADLEGG